MPNFPKVTPAYIKTNGISAAERSFIKSAVESFFCKNPVTFPIYASSMDTNKTEKKKMVINILI